MTLAEIYMEKGKAEGKAEGKRESRIEIAKNLISLDISIEKIVKATGLNEEEIERLQTK